MTKRVAAEIRGHTAFDRKLNHDPIFPARPDVIRAPLTDRVLQDSANGTADRGWRPGRLGRLAVRNDSAA